MQLSGTSPLAVSNLSDDKRQRSTENVMQLSQNAILRSYLQAKAQDIQKKLKDQQDEKQLVKSQIKKDLPEEQHLYDEIARIQKNTLSYESLLNEVVLQRIKTQQLLNSKKDELEICQAEAKTMNSGDTIKAMLSKHKELQVQLDEAAKIQLTYTKMIGEFGDQATRKNRLDAMQERLDCQQREYEELQQTRLESQKLLNMSRRELEKTQYLLATKTESQKQKLLDQRIVTRGRLRQPQAEGPEPQSEYLTPANAYSKFKNFGLKKMLDERLITKEQLGNSRTSQQTMQEISSLKQRSNALTQQQNNLLVQLDELKEPLIQTSTDKAQIQVLELKRLQNRLKSDEETKRFGALQSSVLILNEKLKIFVCEQINDGEEEDDYLSALFDTVEQQMVSLKEFSEAVESEPRRNRKSASSELQNEREDSKSNADQVNVRRLEELEFAQDDAEQLETNTRVRLPASRLEEPQLFTQAVVGQWQGSYRQMRRELKRRSKEVLDRQNTKQ